MSSAETRPTAPTVLPERHPHEGDAVEAGLQALYSWNYDSGAGD
jgi:hypothetical protein